MTKKPTRSVMIVRMTASTMSKKRTTRTKKTNWSRRERLPRSRRDGRKKKEGSWPRRSPGD